MNLHSLVSIKSKRVQRVGRGGKRGHTAGRGTKGQRSRAGHRIRPAERDLIIRIPKRRGFRNKPKREQAIVFNVGMLASQLKTLAPTKTPIKLTVDFLKTAGIISKNFGGAVKILGQGEIMFPVAVHGIVVSASAKKKIEKAGGSVES
jgi:large subunit ribosomal protein L15